MSVHLEAIRKRYTDEFGFELLVTDPAGEVISGKAQPTACDCANESGERRRQAAEQSQRWGECIISLCCDNGYALWGVPIMDNNIVTGALIVQGIDIEGKSADEYRSIQEAADALHEIALEANLLNKAEVELARIRAHQEQDRFLAIEATKTSPVSDDIRSIYLSEEAELLSAIKQGENKAARAILNRILMGIYGIAGERMELLKSSILELVVMMSRAAVEAGAAPSTVLGNNYRSLTELSIIDDEEELAQWIRRMLEALIETIQSTHDYPHSLLILKAVRYMQEHIHQNLRRDEVARIAGLSPSHFSRLMSERLGRSFSSLVTQMRVNRAKELLHHSQKSLSEIAAECGFFDQSHFNRSFRSETGYSPGEYRKGGK
jgi:AraC-like DNA-binding protein